MNGSYGELVSIFYLKRLRNYVKKNYAAGHCKMWFYLFELTLAKKRFTPCEMVTVLENSVFFVYHFVSGHLGVLTDVIRCDHRFTLNQAYSYHGKYCAPTRHSLEIRTKDVAII